MSRLGLWRWVFALTYMAVLVGYDSAGLASTGELVVTQITEKNARQHVQSGPDAVGGIGDWALSNGTVCAIVSDLDHESELSLRGGVLIDLDLCGHGGDHYVAGQDLFDSNRQTPVNAREIEGKVHDNVASIRVLGQQQGMYVETTYWLDTKQKSRLKIRKRIWREMGSFDFRAYTSLFFNFHSMKSFTASTSSPDRSNGFAQRSFLRRGLGAITDFAQSADLIVALTPKDAEAGLAYGWHMKSAELIDPAGNKKTLPFFALSDFEALAFMAFPKPLVLTNDMNIVSLLQLPSMSLTPGHEMVLTEEIILGARSDVASVTDQLHSGAPVVQGQTEPGTAVHADLSGGAPFTQAFADQDGAFAMRLPEGDYRLRFVAAGKRLVERPVIVPKEGAQLGTVDLAPPASLLLPRGAAMRLVFHGRNGTPDPDFGDDQTGYTQYDGDNVLPLPAVTDVFLAGVDSDPESLTLPEGDYRVYATRGPEFSLTHADVSVRSGQIVPLQIEVPTRVVETPGWMAADLHTHSGFSFDSAFSAKERVRSFVAEGGEIFVATEHETIFDFAPVIRAMRLSRKIALVTGTEITSEVPSDVAPFSIGHANAFPVKPQKFRFRNGAPLNEGRRWRDVFADLEARPGKRILQLNHARESDVFAPGSDAWQDPTKSINPQAYFDHMGPAGRPFDPTQSLASDANSVLIEKDPQTGLRDIDFDAMEIMNGPQGKGRVRALMRDWMSLLNQGERLTGTANSDSHTAKEIVLMPRNMVAQKKDTVAQFKTSDFVSKVKKGALYGTTGPFLQASLNGKSLGETHKGNTGALRVQVDAAPWVNVTTMDVIVNGKTVFDVPVRSGTTSSIPLSFEKDSYVVLVVEGEASEAYKAVYPKNHPYAFTNPIYVDADRNGKWTPPGL